MVATAEANRPISKRGARAMHDHGEDVAAERIGAEREGGVLARPQFGRADDAQRIDREQERRQQGDQSHQQDHAGPDQRAAVAGEPA